MSSLHRIEIYERWNVEMLRLPIIVDKEFELKKQSVMPEKKTKCFHKINFKSFLTSRDKKS